MHVIYVVLKQDSAFPSQVLAYLEHLSERFPLRVTLLLGGSGSDTPQALAPFANHPNRAVKRFRLSPLFAVTDRLNMRAMAHALSQMALDHRTVIHTRGEMAGHLVIGALHRLEHTTRRVVVDVRGAYREEIRDFWPTPRLIREAKLFRLSRLYGSIRSAGAITTVSQPLQTYLEQQYDLPSTTTTVIPCVAGPGFRHNPERRAIMRKHLGISETEPVILFSTGGEDQWQCLDTITRFLGRLGARGIVLARKKLDHPAILSRFVPYAEVPGYLDAADIGLLWRDDHVVNRVASPIKFGEYLCSGLPVLANGTVLSVRQRIVSDDVGQVLSDPDDLTTTRFQQLLAMKRTRIAAVGEKHYAMQSVVQHYHTLYETLLSEG
ncbi:MAG: hypothetical protein HQL50_02560 [Magnetococcales bacterium]|nr:hypothetical protein [Magnetococcales bacterium]